MKSLIYLMLITAKNKLLELKRHPAKLILMIFVILMLALVIGTSFLDGPTEGLTYRPINELYAIILALYTFIFGLGALQGLKSGSSFFSIADVQLVFPAPISSRKVLLYGLIKQMSTSLLVGFFLLYQFSWVHQNYGVSFAFLLFVLLGYGICMFTSQLTAMAIYVFTSDNERRQKLVRIAIYAVVGLLALYILYPLLNDQADPIGTITTSADSFVVSLLPVAGWMKAAIVGCFSGNIVMALFGFGATALFIFGLLFAITKAHSDFYEDVLQATEVSHSVITAKKEGNLESLSTQNVKVGKQGINKGFGASAFFFKHLLENRRSKFFLLDKTSFLFLVINIGFAFMTRDQGLMPILFFSTYLQLFSISAGRWAWELKRPFVYVVPESPFKKLISICSESVYKAIVEAAVLFIVIGYMLGLSPIQIAACIVMRIGFAILLIAVNILIERIFGTIASKVIMIMIYLLVLLVLCAPGVVLGIYLTIAVIPSLEIALVTTFVWNVFVSSLVLFFCRNILNYAELNNR